MKILCKLTCFLTAFLLILCTPFFYSCKKTDYSGYLSELRSDIFTGEADNLKLKAVYGFTLKERSNQKAKYYILKFTLFGEVQDFSTYTLVYNYNGLEYKGNFELDPAHSTLICQFNIENFNQKSFGVEVLCSSNRTKINMQSIIPKNTLSYTEALNKLWQNQQDLMNSYLVDGSFNARLIERIIIKDNVPYYYIGIEQHSKLIAFLLDGYTGKELAVRNVFS